MTLEMWIYAVAAFALAVFVAVFVWAVWRKPSADTADVPACTDTSSDVQVDILDGARGVQVLDLGDDPLDPHGDGTIRKGDPLYDLMMGGALMANRREDGKWDVKQFQEDGA